MLNKSSTPQDDWLWLLTIDTLSSVSQNQKSIKHPEYQVFGSHTFAEADIELRDFWWSRTPEERMEALEELRIRVYGEEKINARIPRVFGVPEPRRS